MHSIDVRIAAHAARQLGLVTLEQAQACGATRAEIRSRLGSGRWGRMHPTVFRLAGTPPTRDQALLGACLAAGNDALLSHAAAGWVYEVPSLELKQELTIGADRKIAVRATTVHRSRTLTNADRIEVRRLPLTTPARTVIDLASRFDVDTLDAAVDYFYSRGLATPESITRRLDALGGHGRAGVALLREVLADQPKGARPRANVFERRLVRILKRLPGDPELQYHLVLPDGSDRYLDAAYPAECFGIEADSFEFHAGRRHWARNHVRNVELLALGWRIFPVTWFDLRDRPEWVLKNIALARGLLWS